MVNLVKYLFIISIFKCWYSFTIKIWTILNYILKHLLWKKDIGKILKAPYCICMLLLKFFYGYIYSPIKGKGIPKYNPLYFDSCSFKYVFSTIPANDKKPTKYLVLVALFCSFWNDIPFPIPAHILLLINNWASNYEYLYLFFIEYLVPNAMPGKR